MSSSPRGCPPLPARNSEKRYARSLRGRRSGLSWPPGADETQRPIPGRVPPDACEPLRATAASAGSARPRRPGLAERSVPPGSPAPRSPARTRPSCRGCAGGLRRTPSGSRRCAVSHEDARSRSQRVEHAAAQKTPGCELVAPHRKPRGIYSEETVRRLRPCLRRRDRTLRPPGVLIRARNPWVLARFLFRG